jgi:hypothetical protein
MNFINYIYLILARRVELPVQRCEHVVRPGRAGSDLLELKEFQEPTHHTACTMGKV